MTRNIGGNMTEESMSFDPVESMSFEAILDEVYQGEVIGEAFFSTLLRRFKSPDQQYKLGSLLQLETEFKAKVRPIAIAHGLDPVEREESRQKGQDFAGSLEGETWEEVMASFADLMRTLVARYREMGAAAPSDYKEFGVVLAAHEKSIGDFAKLEAEGETDNSINDVVQQLIHTLPSPKEG
jgi:hypothetical protein